MLDRLFREPLARLALPLARALNRAGISPNLLTVLGTVIVAAAALLIVDGDLPLAGWVLLGGIVFDILDGSVARARTNQNLVMAPAPAEKPEKLGAFLDSTTDRLSDGLIFSALAWHFALLPARGLSLLRNSLLGLALTLVAAVLAFLTSYIRARAEGLGFDCTVGIAERPERMTLVISGLVLTSLIIPALAILVAISLITVLQRFVHVWSQARTPTPL